VGLEHNVVSEFLFINFDGEFADGVITQVLAADIVILILDLKDQHYIFPCVFKPDGIGEIFKNHFNCVIKTIIERSVILVKERMIMHSQHFFLIEKNYLLCSGEAPVFKALD
jgi:hypothetical protein